MKKEILYISPSHENDIDVLIDIYTSIIANANTTIDRLNVANSINNKISFGIKANLIEFYSILAESLLNIPEKLISGILWKYLDNTLYDHQFLIKDYFTNIIMVSDNNVRFENNNDSFNLYNERINKLINNLLFNTTLPQFLSGNSLTSILLHDTNEDVKITTDNTSSKEEPIKDVLDNLDLIYEKKLNVNEKSKESEISSNSKAYEIHDNVTSADRFLKRIYSRRTNQDNELVFNNDEENTLCEDTDIKKYYLFPTRINTLIFNVAYSFPFNYRRWINMHEIVAIIKTKKQPDSNIRIMYEIYLPVVCCGNPEIRKIMISAEYTNFAEFDDNIAMFTILNYINNSFFNKTCYYDNTLCDLNKFYDLFSSKYFHVVRK